MMVINNNIPALTTYGIVNNTSNQLQKSIQKLSTGLRINSAADDAAGLSISEKMRAQINGLDRAVANAQDGVSLIQTAEGALTETHSILQRMRELSVQAANDTLTAQDRSYIQEEVDLLRDEIDHIGNTTTFNTKKLLNGDAAVLWSSDKLSTKAIVNGGLREIDQFGQKKSFEGNYKIAITANPGQAEIQKTDIFKVKHEVPKHTILNDTYVNDLSSKDLTFADDVSEGNTKYTVTLGSPAAVTTALWAKSGDNLFADDAISGALTSGVAELAVSIKSFSVGSYDDTTTPATAQAGLVTFNVSGFITNEDGSITDVNEDVKFSLTTPTSADDIANRIIINTAAAQNIGSTGLQLDPTKFTTLDLTNIDESTTVGLFSTGVAGGAEVGVTIQGDYDKNNSIYNHTYNLKTNAIKGNTLTLNQLTLNKETGGVTRSSVTLTFDDNNTNVTTANLIAAGDVAEITEYDIGEVANKLTRLYDLDKFWDSQGNFMLEDPQTITINQGNGKSASVTLYAYDRIKDVEEKLNAAIADQLGQKEYVAADAAGTADKDKGVNQFVNYVNVGSGKDSTAESVEGTFVIRSLVPGTDGTLRFASKNEDLINALSLNTIQEAKASTYNVSITDAHTGETVVEDTTITGNKLMGALHPNIDVEFDATGGLQATWDNATKKFTYADSETQYTILHLADNTMTFQIGANEGDDMGIHIGDMRAHALGLDSVLVTDRDSASRSITIIDSAIDKVSTQRAKLGAYQNRLEHTMTNLSTSAENLTASESRIRDTDMAKEMMNFTKLQIMLQAGNSMLAQANQLPQNVLSLIR